MWKHSHYIVAVRLADAFSLTKIQKLVLVYGSLVPDLKPSCYYKPHTVENWTRYTNKMLSRVKQEDRTSLYYYRLGKLLHLYADFYTRPHNTSNLLDFLNNHVKWEKELDRQITRLFTVSHNTAFTSLSSLRRSYDDIKDTKTSSLSLNVALDLTYIQSMCYCLCLEVGLIKCSRVLRNLDVSIAS